MYLKNLFSLFLFFPLLAIIYYIFMRWTNVNVVFYTSLYATAIAVCLWASLVFLIPYFRLIRLIEKIHLTVIVALIGYVLSISLPTVIDRSLSFYILEKLEQRGGGIQIDKFSYVFTNEYLVEHRLVDIRITEQIESGTIFLDGNCVRLTDRGRNFSAFSVFFRKNFLPQNRLIRGNYTNDLINPFSNSNENTNIDYAC
jgi:hypothetical protein